jgi:hypothetical protein
MLTGYNTDIRRGDLVVHVQTEDKGVDSASVESLVYLGGRVVASKSSSYADLLDDGESEAAIQRFMDRQHRTVVAALERGRLDARLGLNGGGNGDAGADGSGGDEAGDRAPSGIHAVVSEREIADESAIAEAADETERELEPAVAEGGGQDAVPASGEGGEAASASSASLSLDLSSATPLSMGETVVVWIRASRGDAAAAGVDIRIEMISTVQAPVVLAEGATDSEGLFKTDLAVPDLEQGSAAIIVGGAEGGGFAEVKRLL